MDKFLKVLIILWMPLLMQGQSENRFDWQGHRGARGLMPENTIPAFIKAVELGVQTLELDLAMSSDSILIVSHEPWFSSVISSHSDGREVAPVEETALRIWSMTYDEIQTYDVGKRGNPRFPQQEKVASSKPSLDEVLLAVQNYCTEKKLPLPRWNIEIKTQPIWDNLYTPQVEAFANAVGTWIKQHQMTDQVTVQSFDVRTLQAMHKQFPDVQLAYLHGGKPEKQQIKALGWFPAISSPNYEFVDEKWIKWCHKHNMKVIPWTVNTKADMALLQRMGVDGIITDYPNLIMGDK